MITEDYVSFEVAKLLKEKGFNESCYTYYDGIDNSVDRFDKGLHFNNTSYPWGIPYDINKAKKYIVAPTLQMAMKWLRDVYDCSIEITSNGYLMDNDATWECDIKFRHRLYFRHIQCEKTYEVVVEAALNYVLKNLI